MTKLLKVKTRERILRFLYDEKPRSAYRISKGVGVTTATTIEHLHFLEQHELTKSKDNSKGHLRRFSHEITKKGKSVYMEHMGECFKEIIKLLEEDSYLLTLFFNIFYCCPKDKFSIIDYSIMKPIDIRICKLLINARRPLSTLEIAKYGNICWLTAKRHLDKLVKDVQSIKTYKNGNINMWTLEKIS